MNVEQALREFVTTLAVEIGERHVGRPRALARAAAWIESTWRAQGYEVAGQGYAAAGVPVRNLEVVLPGGASTVVVGAHYDTVPGSPGANDNGSGVAALLVLSELLRHGPRRDTIRFVAFVNEEPPFFQSELMGSRVCARALRRGQVDVRGMLALETIGCYLDTPGSQGYPPQLAGLYPDTGNFIGVVGDLRSREWVAELGAALRQHSSVPVQSAAAPAGIEGVGFSDHWSFWQEGYPAAMLTDTAFFRYEHYHRASDLPEQLQYAPFAAVVAGLARALKEIT